MTFTPEHSKMTAPKKAFFPSLVGWSGRFPPSGNDVRYGTYDHRLAAIWTDYEGWVYGDNGWERINVAELVWNAGLASETYFRNMYPALPPLPHGAFA